MRGRPRIISLQKVGVPHHFPNWRSLCVGVGVDGVEPSRAVSLLLSVPYSYPLVGVHSVRIENSIF